MEVKCIVYYRGGFCSGFYIAPIFIRAQKWEKISRDIFNGNIDFATEIKTYKSMSGKRGGERKKDTAKICAVFFSVYATRDLQFEMHFKKIWTDKY